MRIPHSLLSFGHHSVEDARRLPPNTGGREALGMERNRRKRSGFSLFTADGLVSAAASPRAVDAPREQLIKQLDDAVKGSKVREVEMAKAAMRHEAPK